MDELRKDGFGVVHNVHNVHKMDEAAVRYEVPLKFVGARLDKSGDAGVCPWSGAKHRKRSSGTSCACGAVRK
jgi:hypothetical protein